MATEPRTERSGRERRPTGRAVYDDIADWYEHDFLRQGDGSDPIGIKAAIRTLLGVGTLRCLEIGCGTGIHAAQLTDLGWHPVGVDLSAGMLRHARGRLAVARGDATVLPFGDDSIPAVLAAMVHTDMADYQTVLTEAHRVLEPGGLFVHVGVHPCFCGGFADRSDPDGIVIRPGYLDASWTTASWTDQGVRDKVGAEHWPLAWLLNTTIEAGFDIEELHEGGAPTPTTLSLRARKPQVQAR